MKPQWIAAVVSWSCVGVFGACPSSIVLNLTEGQEAIEHVFGGLGRDTVQDCYTMVEVFGSDCYSGMKVEVEVGARSKGNLEARYQSVQKRRQKHGQVKDILEVCSQVLHTLVAITEGFDFRNGDPQKSTEAVAHLNALTESLDAVQDLIKKGLEVKREREFLKHLRAVMEGTNHAKVLLDGLAADEVQVTSALREALGGTLGSLEGLMAGVDDQGKILENAIQLAFLAMRREKLVEAKESVDPLG